MFLLAFNGDCRDPIRRAFLSRPLFYSSSILLPIQYAKLDRNISYCLPRLLCTLGNGSFKGEISGGGVPFLLEMLRFYLK